MKSKSLRLAFATITLAVTSAPADLHATVLQAFDGIQLTLADNARLSGSNANVSLYSTSGGLIFESTVAESFPAAGDGGINILGSPVAITLYRRDSLGNFFTDDPVFSINESETWGITDPIFEINGATKESTFSNSDVSIDDGSLKVDGSDVLTAASAPVAGFIQTSTLESALNGMTTPPSSTAWTTAFVKRGNITGTGLIALGTGQASGAFSMALGNGTVASSLGTFAAGLSSKASGSRSVALGYSAEAYANYSISAGYFAKAGTTGSTTTAQYSTAIGPHTLTQGDYSLAVGSHAEAHGFHASSVGGKAYGNYSFATTAGRSNGAASIAMGGWWNNGTTVTSPGPNTAAGDQSAAIGGVKNTATGRASFASGVFNAPSAAVSTSFGSGAIGGGTATAWVEDEPLFELGNTAVDLSVTAPVEPTTGRSNAMTTLKNGQTTLINKAWQSAVTADPDTALDDPAATTDSNGNALVVRGHTVLAGKVTIAVPQGDISMGIFE